MLSSILNTLRATIFMLAALLGFQAVATAQTALPAGAIGVLSPVGGLTHVAPENATYPCNGMMTFIINGQPKNYWVNGKVAGTNELVNFGDVKGNNTEAPLVSVKIGQPVDKFTTTNDGRDVWTKMSNVTFVYAKRGGNGQLAQYTISMDVQAAGDLPKNREKDKVCNVTPLSRWLK